MSIPNTGFAIHIIRDRVEKRGANSGVRYRTIGHYKCYMHGQLIDLPDLMGATIEPNGPGDNSQTGVNKSRRLEEGTYPLGTHGWNGAKYRTFNYKKNQKPYPGVYVHDTNERSAILIHRGVGFKATIGCINLTGSIVGPHDDIGPNTSFRRMDSFIQYMKDNVVGFPSSSGERINNAVMVISGDP